MELGSYVESLQRQVLATAEAGGDDARALAERLLPALDAALRLTFQAVLATAAEEITTELAPGSVELRLRGRDLELVVTPPPAEAPANDLADRVDGTAHEWRALAGDERAMSRINVRMPDHLKARIEHAASGEGLSVNAWLVRAAAAALERTDPDLRRDGRARRGAQRYTGWAR